MAKEKILVVDDSATQLIMYKMALTKSGYLVISAKNGVEGMGLVETENPDLIVSDIIMPELNGYQFCRLVKDDPSRSHIPIILLTSLGQQQDRFWGIEAGANSFVIKSVNTSELLSEVERLLKTTVKPAITDFVPKEEGRLHIDNPENAEESIKSKLNRILEKLLYESTVSNRMRDLSRYAYNRQEMFAKCFDLFRQIVEYHTGILTLFEKDSISFTLDVQKDISDSFLDKSIAVILEQEFNPDEVRHGFTKTVKRDILGESRIRSSGVTDVQSFLVVPLRDGEAVIGSLSVFAAEGFVYNRDIYRLMQIITRELTLTLKYIWKLEEIERMKGNFTSTIVNDLRSPVIANQSFADALFNEYVDPITEDQKEILSNIITNNKKLLSFMNDIIDISKVESGSLEVFPEHHSIKAMLDDAIKNMTILAEQKDILISHEFKNEALKGYFDGEKIVQVFNNLIGNAIKFTSPGGSITLGATKDDTGPNAIRFWVQDTGVGIPEEELSLIFEKYKNKGGVFSSDDHAGGGGIGLGLAICKSITEAHQGRIWVESKVGEGSTFYFTVNLGDN